MKRKRNRSRIEKGKSKANPNPNPRSKSARDAEGDLPVGPYLTVPTAAGAALGVHHADRGVTGASAPPPRKYGTTAEPLDGDALTRRGARAPARGPAAAPPSPSSRPPWAGISLMLSLFWGYRNGEEERNCRGATAALGRAALLRRGGWQRPAAGPPRRRCLCRSL
jgi:hypothetical protein